MELFPIYDQDSKISPNIWYSISGLGESPTMRVGHTMVHRESETKGKLYIIGGANPSGSFNDIYTLDMDTLSWDKLDEINGEDFSKGRYEHSCLNIEDDGRFFIYIFGGSNEDGSLNDMLEFDFNDKKYSIRCSRVKPESSCVPTPRTCHVGTTYKNQLIVFGGGEEGKKPVTDPKLYIYNPKTRKWVSLTIQGAQTPALRHGHLMIGDGDTIYLHGGMNEDQIFDDMWRIDLKKLNWSPIESSGPRPCARAAHGGVCVNSAVFLFGGLAQTGLALDDLWKYDPGTNQWSSIEMFGHRPPNRLDFAYCKMKFRSNCQDENDKEAYFLVIHGGMDTEGSVFDDLFFINLE